MEDKSEEQKQGHGEQPSEQDPVSEIAPDSHGTVDARKVHHPKRWVKILVTLVVLAIAALAWVWFALGNDANAPTQTSEQPVISSYEECVAAGYPVMESYPEQCSVPDGETFVRQLSEEEQANLDAAVQQDDDTEEPEADNSSKYGEILVTKVEEGIIDNYDQAYNGWGDKVTVVTINAKNTTDASIYYYIEQFRGELASGEIINSHVPEYDDELFVQFTLAPDGSKTAKLAFRTDENVSKLLWRPQNQPIGEQQEYSLNQSN